MKPLKILRPMSHKELQQANQALDTLIKFSTPTRIRFHYRERNAEESDKNCSLLLNNASIGLFVFTGLTF